MRKSALDLLAKVLPDDGWIAVSWTATGVLAWWSAILFIPPSTFSTSPTYDFFASLGSEGTWAVVFALGAAIGAWGNLSHSREVHSMSMLVMSTMHMLIGIGCALGNAATTGTGTYLLLAFLVLGRLIADGRARKI